METILCEVVTAERMIFADLVNEVLAPGVWGQVGILPKHAPLITSLSAGELVIRKDGDEDVLIAIHGGFMEVREDKVTVLADTAERAEEIDIARAEAAQAAAKERLESSEGEEDLERARAALRRASLRLKVAGRKRRWPRERPGMGTPETEG
jgi:F-type H+-transporting ATPase subunit epsilon